MCISPFAKTDQLWFNADKEPETMEYEIYKATDDYFQKDPKEKSLRISLDTSSSDRYYEVLQNIRNNANDFKFESSKREPDGSLSIDFIGDSAPIIEL